MISGGQGRFPQRIEVTSNRPAVQTSGAQLPMPGKLGFLLFERGIYFTRGDVRGEPCRLEGREWLPFLEYDGPYADFNSGRLFVFCNVVAYTRY